MGRFLIELSEVRAAISENRRRNLIPSVLVSPKFHQIGSRGAGSRQGEPRDRLPERVQRQLGAKGFRHSVSCREGHVAVAKAAILSIIFPPLSGLSGKARTPPQGPKAPNYSKCHLPSPLPWGLGPRVKATALAFRPRWVARHVSIKPRCLWVLGGTPKRDNQQMPASGFPLTHAHEFSDGKFWVR